MPPPADRPDPDRRPAFTPRRHGAWLRFPVVANWLPALTLLSAFIMPQVTGCDGMPVYPFDFVEPTEPASILLVWHHGYGLFVLGLFAIVILADRRESDRILAWSTIAFWIVLATGIGSSLLLTAEPSFIIVWLPFLVLPTVFTCAAIRRKDWISAWARTASGIAAVAMFWTMCIYLFHRASRFGILVTYTSLLALTLAPWLLRASWRRTLIAKTEPATPIQFRLWHLLAASAVVALLYAYYRYLPDLIDG